MRIGVHRAAWLAGALLLSACASQRDPLLDEPFVLADPGAQECSPGGVGPDDGIGGTGCPATSTAVTRGGYIPSFEPLPE